MPRRGPAPNRARQQSRPGTESAWFVMISSWNSGHPAQGIACRRNRSFLSGIFSGDQRAGGISLCPKRRAADIRSLKLLFITILIVKRGRKLVKKLLQFREDFPHFIKKQRQKTFPARQTNAHGECFSNDSAPQGIAGSIAAGPECRLDRHLFNRSPDSF